MADLENEHFENSQRQVSEQFLAEEHASEVNKVERAVQIVAVAGE